MKKKYPYEVIFWTDIATPYRTTFYNFLEKKGLFFNVWYVKRKLRTRTWDIKKMPIEHNHIIGKGITYASNIYNFHFNPILIIKACFLSRQTILILGLSWNDFNVLFIAILKKIGLIRSKITFWSEANYLTLGARKKYWFKTKFRQWIYDITDAPQISSGKMTKDTFKIWGIKNNSYIDLPNTIQEDSFEISKSEINDRDYNNPKVILIAARLIESIKGIHNFLSSIGEARLRKVKILIAGDGPDRKIIEDFVTKNNLEKNIILLGEITPSELCKVYKKSNIFCLPSYTDACPLSVNEAMKMHLPLLISNRCGNNFEAVIQNENGYTFDPDDKVSIQKSFDLILRKDISLKDYGAKSYKIFEKEYSIEVVVKNFIEQVRYFSMHEK